MKFPPFPLVVLGLQVDRALAAFRPDIKGPVEVAELEPDQVVTDDATEVEMRLPPGSDFVVLFKCSEDNKEIAVSDDNQFVGCCLPGQHLSGSEQTSFDCCGQNHDLAGDAQVGYVCCPTGYVYDGSKCKEGSGSNDVGGTRQPVQQQQQMVSKGGSRAIGKSKASDGNGSGADSNGGGSDSNDRGGDNVGGSSDGQDGVDDRSDQGQAQNHHNHPQMVQQQQHNAKDDGNPYGNERNNNMQQPQSRYQGAGSYQADGSFQAGGSYQGGGRGNGNGGSKALCGIGTTLVNGQCVCTSGECGPGPVTIITCANGTQPVNGKCVCPKGYTWGSDGWCRPCTSGLETGKTLLNDLLSEYMHVLLAKSQSREMLHIRLPQWEQLTPHRIYYHRRLLWARSRRSQPPRRKIQTL